MMHFDYCPNNRKPWCKTGSTKKKNQSNVGLCFASPLFQIFTRWIREEIIIWRARLRHIQTQTYVLRMCSRISSDTIDGGRSIKLWEKPSIQCTNHTCIACKSIHEKRKKKKIQTGDCEWQDPRRGRLFYLAQLKRQKAQNKRSAFLHSLLWEKRLISRSSVISEMLHRSLRRGPSRKQTPLNSQRPLSLSL